MYTILYCFFINILLYQFCEWKYYVLSFLGSLGSSLPKIGYFVRHLHSYPNSVVLKISNFKGVLVLSLSMLQKGVNTNFKFFYWRCKTRLNIFVLGTPSLLPISLFMYLNSLVTENRSFVLQIGRNPFCGCFSNFFLPGQQVLHSY